MGSPQLALQPNEPDGGRGLGLAVLACAMHMNEICVWSKEMEVTEHQAVRGAWSQGAGLEDQVQQRS
jgi:hypothetical protein